MPGCARSLRSGVGTMLDLLWRPRAHLDRESIAIYLGLECGNPDAALAVMRRIDAALERARAFPDSGGHLRIEGLAHDDYRKAYADPYVVVYRFDVAAVMVYRILHQRQSLDAYSLVDFPSQ